mgnify:CR=1 FL=1
MEKEIKKIISGMSFGQRKYETKQSKKKGFKNLEDYVKYKIENQTENKIKKEISERLATERKFWKKTQGDLFKHLKGTPIGDYPFFDINYWTKLNTNYVKEVSTKTSKEMMEHFIISNANYDPDLFGGMTAETSERGSITFKTFMFYAWNNLLDMDSSKSEDVQFRNYEPFKWFNELEHLIQNDELFYALLQKVWLFGSHLLTNKEEMFYRFGRSKISFHPSKPGRKIINIPKKPTITANHLL